MRILVIEDEKKVARVIQQGLKEKEYDVDVASDGEEGIKRALSESYDLEMFLLATTIEIEIDYIHGTCRGIIVTVKVL